MAVLKPRERLVYFRISEDEYRQFASVCEQGGARSVSDLARNAVQRLIADGERHQQGDEMEAKIRLLERLITAVTEQLQFLGGNPTAEVGTLRIDPCGDRVLPEAKSIDQNGHNES